MAELDNRYQIEDILRQPYMQSEFDRGMIQDYINLLVP